MIETVSIIIPCYNVSTYVEQCLLSIVKQTYPKLEILAIDDGSPDNTPVILDKMAKQYPQLRVIHQKNAGVSAARNTGLQQATGDYVMFVDGDDFLAPDAVDYFVDLVKQTGAEFCLSTDCYTRKHESQTNQQTIHILSSAEAVALLLSPRVIVGCWNKIYKRSFLTTHNCQFSTDLFYGEGLNFITTVAQLSDRVGVGNRKVYYYRRNNEYSATTCFNIKQFQNNLSSIARIESNLTQYTPTIDTMLVLHRSMFCMSTAVRIRAKGLTKMYAQQYNESLSYVRHNYLKLVFKKEVSLYRKCLLLGGCISPWLLAKLDVIRRKHIVKRSVK